MVMFSFAIPLSFVFYGFVFCVSFCNIFWGVVLTSGVGGGGGDFIGMALLFQHMFSGRDLVSLFWISQKIICLDVLVKFLFGMSV